jgi:peptidoglycan/LPS O-acetylase OafA/YrhL
MIRRLFRIFPALIVALCVFWGSYWLLQSAFPSVFHVYFTPGQFLSNLSLRRISMYGVSWSLQVELQAVPFILLGFWLWRRAGDAGLAVYLALALLARDAPWLTLNLTPLNDHLFLFVLGMLAVGPVGEAATRKLRDRGLLAIPLITILGASLVDYRAEMVRPFQGLLAALFVAALLHGRAARIGDMLRSRASQFLGRISYAFYVINPIFLEFNRTVIAKVFGLPPANFGSELLLGVSATACAVPLSALCYRHVELPGIRAGKRVFPLLRKIARRDSNAAIESGERTQRP